jgi:hypothetical protein
MVTATSLLIHSLLAPTSAQGELAMQTSSADQDPRNVEEVIREAPSTEEGYVAFSKPLWIAVMAVTMFGAGVSLLLYFGD